MIASRLAEADRDLSILVIEQGPNNYQMPEVVHPALYPRNLFPSSKITLFWQTNKSDQLGGRAPIVPSGGTLGGGSAMNWMVYTRAQRSDFDSWNTPGWSADEMMPFLKKVSFRLGMALCALRCLLGFRKSNHPRLHSLIPLQLETYHGQGERKHHGYDGPVNVSKGTHIAHEAEDEMIRVAAQLGYPEVKDLQNLDNNNAIERYQKYIGPNGRRQDAAHRYLHPKLRSGEYPNLHVLVEKQVIKVLFDDNKRAVGVEYQTNPKFLANPEFMATSYASPRTVKARKLVIVSTGANGTPLVLERSGLGNSEILQKAGVPVVEDLPGIGEEYQDHHLSLWAYRTNLSPRETINGFADGRFDIEEAISQRDELLGTNAMDARKFMHPLHIIDSYMLTLR